MLQAIPASLSAVQAFTAKLASGQITLPSGLPTDPNLAIFPNSIYWNGQVVPIVYDETTKTISLKS